MPIINIAYEINRAIGRVAEGAQHWPSSHTNDDAITFLRAVLPPYHPSRLDIDRAAAALITLRKHLAPTDGADREPNDHLDVTGACAAATEHVNTSPVELRLINTRAELAELRREIGLRPDWHEPDEQDIGVTVTGGGFDNAYAITDLETGVVIHQEGNPIAYVGLATLFSFATSGPVEPDGAPPPDTVYAYIQEGGSSTKLYVHASDTLDEAEDARRAYAEEGSYRTTEPVQMPGNTDWNAVEELVQSLRTLTYPSD